LLKEQHKVKVLDNLTYGYHSLLPITGDPNFEFMYGDIRSVDDIKKAIKNVDLIIHLAAIVGYPACKSKPKVAHEINYIGTKKLVDNCNVPIIFASTGSGYGSVNDICNEDTPSNPLTEYAISKIEAEKEIQNCSDFIICRFSTGFGLSYRPRLDLLINYFVYRAVKNKELIVYEKDYWRSFIHIKDMVRSFLFALENFDKMNCEIYNVGSEDLCFTKEQVALHIKKYVDFYLKFAEFGEDPDKRNYKVSFEKIGKLGFRTIYDLDYGIKEMAKAFPYMDQQDWYFNNKVLK